MKLEKHEVMRTIAAAVVVHLSRATVFEGVERVGASEWVVTLCDDGHSQAMALLGGARSFAVSPAGEQGLTVRALDGVGEAETIEIASVAWENGAPLLEIDCGDGHGLKALQYFGPSGDTAYAGYKFNTSGATLRATVLSSKEHE